MNLFSFGEYSDELGYKIVDEHQMRTSAKIILILGLISFTAGLMISYYAVLPFIIGFIMVNFFIGVVINPKFSPTIILAKFLTRKEEPKPIGAVQKHFAWSLGLLLSNSSFIISIFLQNNPALFELLCAFCIFCNTVLYFEVIFSVCIGCKLYFLALDFKLIKAPATQPRCMGDTCNI